MLDSRGHYSSTAVRRRVCEELELGKDAEYCFVVFLVLRALCMK